MAAIACSWILTANRGSEYLFWRGEKWSRKQAFSMAANSLLFLLIQSLLIQCKLDSGGKTSIV
jgi:hypothetical protein